MVTVVRIRRLTTVFVQEIASPGGDSADELQCSQEEDVVSTQELTPAVPAADTPTVTIQLTLPHARFRPLTTVLCHRRCRWQPTMIFWPLSWGLTTAKKQWLKAYSSTRRATKRALGAQAGPAVAMGEVEGKVGKILPLQEIWHQTLHA